MGSVFVTGGEYEVDSVDFAVVGASVKKGFGSCGFLSVVVVAVAVAVTGGACGMP